MKNIKLIDNRRVKLSEILKDSVKNHDYLSIATGYWDLKGTAEIIDDLMNYKKVRLLIGQEPLLSKELSYRNLSEVKLDDKFPEEEFKKDLEVDSYHKESDKLRATAAKLLSLIGEGILEVKLYKSQRLHAKAYIFGDIYDQDAIGIIGSSNFTHAGLVGSAELNSLETQPQMVVYQPADETMPHGHLSWFNELWKDPSSEDWNQEFTTILENSPLGNLCFSPYESYIKTLMELYPEELETPVDLNDDTKDVLFSFQNRNASLLIQKLEQMQVAILADSVGLGKTITAGAVMKHYLESERENILVIAPAALKQQWKDDLGRVLGVDYLDGAFQLVSQQDTNAINKIKEDYDKNWRKHKKIDLFVIDEAHNLRSSSGVRRDGILDLLQQHPNAHILLLTATPINNTLMDIANQIQLASKGKLFSFNVPYVRPNGRETEIIDFFDALKRIQKYIRTEEKSGNKVDYNLFKKTIHAGLRHYLVRSTRQGVEAEGAMKNGIKIVFPKSNVESIEYSYSEEVNFLISSGIELNISNIFEDIDPRLINLNVLSEFTQQTSHPIDIIKEISNNRQEMIDKFDIDEKDIEDQELILDSPVSGMINNLLQVIYLLGFPAYKPETYKYKYYGLSVDSLRSLSDTKNLGVQLSIHNMLHITWLKRLESSTYALFKSIQNYEKRLNVFSKYLNLGYIVSLEDAKLLEREYGQGDDIDQAFDEYEDYLKEAEKLIGTADEGSLKKYGVKQIKADSKEYNIEQLKRDIQRDQLIINLLLDLLAEINKVDNNSKLNNFKDYVVNTIKNNKYGKKILVFSFFADTISFLESNLPELFKNDLVDFKKESAFLSGKSSSVENIVNRFSPESKGYVIKTIESEVNYLFATDILSEGQNLQDAGILINYDLHWNPVRMIQRNGRINRLGSKYSEVLIANMKPSQDIDLYLRLVNRLENKINVIKNTVGLDQGVLHISDINPIQFIEKYYEDGTLPEEDDYLAYTDEHILNLRLFLGDNKDNEEYIQEIKEMPLGKWNYLSENSSFSKTLSLIEVQSNTSVTKKDIKDFYFYEVENEYPHMALYFEQYEALNLLKTDKTENNRLRDSINLDRSAIANRSFGAAKRSAANPKDTYQIDNQYQKALISLQPYFPPTYDFKHILENGIQDIQMKKRIERNLKKVNTEMKDSNTIKVNTITEFTNIIQEIKDVIVEDKVVKETKGVLYYVSRNEN